MEHLKYTMHHLHKGREMKSMWKKTIALSAIALATFSVSAQDIEFQTQRKFQQLNGIIQKLEASSQTMNRHQLLRLNGKLDEALDALRMGPGPGPGPRPPRPPRPRLTTVSGSIENTSFVFDASDSMDLAAQCIGQFEGQIGSVDDATVSVNFSEKVTLHTSGWWKSAGEVCTVIAAKATELGLPAKSGFGYTAIGSIEEQTYMFKGHSLKDILVQCTDFYNNQVRKSVDDITIFNGSELVRKHTSGWWSNSNEVCNVIIQEIK